jgi:hypothetical protein
MHDRSMLGAADVSDADLAAMVAVDRGMDPSRVTLLGSSVEEVPYDLPAITTAGRYWVRGTATTDEEPWSFELFVKVVQSWSRSPLFAMVPEHLRDAAAASVPWRTEPLAYRSDLGDRLPDGLRMPRVLGVHDLDHLSAAVWLEKVPAHPVVWDVERFTRAAYLMGRFAASPRVVERADVGQDPFTIQTYLEGRLAGQVLPLCATRACGDIRSSQEPSTTICTRGSWRRPTRRRRTSPSSSRCRGTPRTATPAPTTCSSWTGTTASCSSTSGS